MEVRFTEFISLPKCSTRRRARPGDQARDPEGGGWGGHRHPGLPGGQDELLERGGHAGHGGHL